MALRHEVKTLMAVVSELVKNVESTLKLRYGHQRVLDILTKENEELRAEKRSLITQNNKLLDRLMARDFESYATYTEGEDFQPNPLSGSLNESIEEQYIGEVVENEASGRN